MASDPRKYFSVATCDKGKQIQQNNASNKRDFFSDLGKVGDLELLNDLGYGTVGEGLRTLAKTSNSVRTGVITPESLGPDSNAESYVYGAVGIDSGAIPRASSFNPGVANRASGQAKSIFEKVKQGNFELSDIPETFSDLQNLKTLIDGIFTDPNVNTVKEFSMCGASPYATDLISYAPKYKFLFVVQFDFTEPYAKIFKDIQAAFVVKSSSRPNINFDYEEVNMYNFWTRVPKRTIYEPMTMRFYDDNKNQAMELYNSYLQAMSPISNIDFAQNTEALRGVLESTSMDFSGLNGASTYGSAPTHLYSASYGPTAGIDTMNIFKRISLFHVYDAGRKMNVYKFYNPKITMMELDDLDMADNGNGNELSFQFAYDGLNIVTGYNVSNTTDYNIQELSGGLYGASYSLRYNGTPETEADKNQLSVKNEVSQTSTQDDGRSLLSNAFDATSEYLGSQFL